MATNDLFITCANADLSFEQIFRLLARVGSDGNPVLSTDGATAYAYSVTYDIADGDGNLEILNENGVLFDLLNYSKVSLSVAWSGVDDVDTVVSLQQKHALLDGYSDMVDMSVTLDSAASTTPNLLSDFEFISRYCNVKIDVNSSTAGTITLTFIAK